MEPADKRPDSKSSLINLTELRERAREWLLREDIVEKDYVLGWLLWAIGSHPALAEAWIFKGGTCLKKCYFETYRFSEDLDFTLIEGAPHEPGQLKEIFAAIADMIYEASGIEIPKDQIRFEAFTNPHGGQGVEGRVYYRGPRRPGGDLPRVKIDLTRDEVLVYTPVLRPIQHGYSDHLPAPAQVRCYSLPEIFGEKLRTLGERCLPRDVYDVVGIFRREDARGEVHIVRGILADKCQYKEIAVPTFKSVESSPQRVELESEWENMLRHQVPELPPLEAYFAELRDVFAWLEEERIPAKPSQVFPLREEAAPGWTLPATIATWGTAIPLETIRFAGVNRLCVDLGYQRTIRRVEPYSLRRTKHGDLVVYAVRRDTREPRSYRVDRIESVTLTRETFTPVYPIEFWPTGTISAPPITRRISLGLSNRPRPARVVRKSWSGGPRYIVQCTYCGKRFRRRDTILREHKMKGRGGYPCPGRTGFIVRIA